jgi:hypothetical protein
MAEIDPILLKIDKLISISRLKEIAFIIGTDVTERISKISAVLEGLKAGAYLLGTGPSTVGIIPLTVDEIMLGRSATTLEKPSEVLIDYAVSDTLYFMPREVSRAHAKIVRRHNNSDVEFWLVDMKSTCGTYVNSSQIDSDLEGTMLSHGDIISLGPSMISTYVFYIVSS